MWLHRFAVFVSASTVLLVAAGGLVTSTGSGLAVPDWPTTYGWSMFTFPLDRMIGGIRYEHGHRLIASGVGMLTIAQAIWLWFAEDRRWLRRLGVAALAAVIAQGLLGGLTVRYFLPAPISVAHAGLAQAFFCLTVSIALFTSRGWRTTEPITVGDPVLRAVATTATSILYAQILVGATMRHTGAGLAIPDFPLVFGGLVPPEWTAGIAVHYVHRLGAVCALLAVVATVGHIYYHQRHRPDLTSPAALALLLVLIQIALGGLTVPYPSTPPTS
jgi:cytochrome c oxidase assembly protein subunit 15